MQGGLKQGLRVSRVVACLLLLWVAGANIGVAGPTALPQRVVVLEYSFLDAVVAAGVSPVGIADDKKPGRILPAIRRQLGDYQSVGLRGQPDLETIASLKPDLIIADTRRHQGIYTALQNIAPTLLLLSYGAEYQALLDDARVIGKALGRTAQMDAQLAAHQQRMSQFATRLRSDEQLLFAVVSARGMAVHGRPAFASGVLHRLGLSIALPAGSQQPYVRVSLEQLAAMNPDWLFIGDYNAAQGGADILRRWQQHPLWPFLKLSRKQQLLNVDPNSWSLARGIYGAEQIAQDLLATSLARSN